MLESLWLAHGATLVIDTDIVYVTTEIQPFERRIVLTRTIDSDFMPSKSLGVEFIKDGFSETLIVIKTPNPFVQIG
jgi:hypothetical protein